MDMNKDNNAEKDKNDYHSLSTSPARSLTRCSLHILFLITALG